MTYTQRNFLAVLFGAFAIWSLETASCLIAQGCEPHVDPRAANYGARLQECVIANETRAGYEACKRQVNADFDGGGHD